MLRDRILERDLLIEQGQIARVADPGSGRAHDEIDARGRIVLPGAVDAHVHFNEPGRAEWEGWLHGTRGAALGGTTTVADMPLNSIPPTIDARAFDAKREAAAAGAVVDHALWGGLVGTNATELRALRERGIVGVKAFLSESGVAEFPRLADEGLREALAAAAAAGLLVAVHCEDETITSEAGARSRSDGRRDPDAWLASRPAEAEVRAIERLADAALVTGARVHVVHVSSRAAVSAVARARSRAVAITAETCPHYLTFTDEDVRAQGAVLKCAPPIRGSAERDALWSAVGDGGLDLVASDHSPSPADMKRGGDMFSAWGGIAGVQSLLPTVLTAALRDRRVDLLRVRRLLAEAPARVLGLYPRKGTIAEGSDADLVIVDPARTWTLDVTAIALRSALSPYVGRSFTGAIVRTIVRGITVQRDGEVLARPGTGMLVTP